MKRPAVWWRRVPYGSVLGAVAAIYIGVYLIQAVRNNYNLQQQIALLQQQTSNLKVEQQQLQYQIQYYQTDDYKEKEARSRLGLQAPGEGVIILPHADEDTVPKPAAVIKPKPQTNPKQWLDFLSGKFQPPSP